MRVVIAGAGSVGRSIARELLTNGHAVLLVDKDPSAIRVNSVELMPGIVVLFRVFNDVVC